MLVSQILKSKADIAVVTISSGATIVEAAAVLSERRIGALIVSKDGKAAEGILSERDIVRELGARGPAVLGEKVAALMTKKLVSCGRGDQTDAVLQKMTVRFSTPTSSSIRRSMKPEVWPPLNETILGLINWA